MEQVGRDLKVLVEELRNEWRRMWRTRIDDEVRAEAIAEKTYTKLFVDRGLILYATRDYNPPVFSEILEKHLTPEEVERFSPSYIKGGWGKFIREHITHSGKPKKSRAEMVREELENTKKHQQLKHGGRGWLHLSPLRNYTKKT